MLGNKDAKQKTRCRESVSFPIHFEVTEMLSIVWQMKDSGCDVQMVSNRYDNSTLSWFGDMHCLKPFAMQFFAMLDNADGVQRAVVVVRKRCVVSTGTR